MLNRRQIYSGLAGLLILAVIGGMVLYRNNRNQSLQVVFLDVGQGDAILLQQGHNQVLIDGGRDGKQLLASLGKYIPFWDRNIETVVATHPDQDHIGGLIDVLRVYRVGSVVRTASVSDSQAFKVFDEEAGKVENVEATRGVSLQLPAGAALNVLYPAEPISDMADGQSNDASVVLKLIWGENSFLFTGDLPDSRESELTRDAADLDVDVLKVSHHGSKNATSDDFLEKTSPEVGVISVGRGNMYGHPSPELLERLRNHRVEIIRTDERRDIVYECQAASSICQIIY